MEELSIDADLKCAAARGNERERLDSFAEFENFGRQTDGLRRVVSNHAIFDGHFGLHFELLSGGKVIGAAKSGQADQNRFAADPGGYNETWARGRHPAASPSW